MDVSDPRTRVILADDHTLVRAGIRRILESQPEFEVAAEAADGAAAIAAVQQHGADVLVLDLNMNGLEGIEVLRRYRAHLTTQAAGLLKKLQETPEGKGTMLDNTVLVFTSDCANTQHCNGSNWPFVLVGDLGGKLKTGQYVSYPLSGGNQDGSADEHVGTPTSNPAINALYCTLLHAASKPRDSFNAGQAPAELCGPLKELLPS